MQLDTKGWVMNILKIPCTSYLEWLVRTRNDGFSSQHHKTGNIVCVILYEGDGSLFLRKTGRSHKFSMNLLYLDVFCKNIQSIKLSS